LGVGSVSWWHLQCDRLGYSKKHVSVCRTV